MPEFHMVLCFTCGKQFRFGPQQYDGKRIATYQIDVCRSCYDGNWDGWTPRLEPALLAHLAKEGLSIPERNAKDLLPRD